MTSIVKTSPRGFLLALLPLIFLQAVLFVMALLGSQTEPPMIALPTPDRALGLLAERIVMDAALLMIGHFALRGLKICSRAGYATMGGLAAAAGYAVALHYGLILLPPSAGATVTAGGLPVIAGIAAGFLYTQFAGREAVATQPADAAEDPAVAPPMAFDGPVQVRTSFGAMMLASFIPALLIALVTFMLTYSFVSGTNAVTEPVRFDWSRQILALGLPAQMFLTTAIVTTLPATLVIALSHSVVRALRRTRGRDYAVAGAVAGLLIGVLLVPFGGWPRFRLPASAS